MSRLMLLFLCVISKAGLAQAIDVIPASKTVTIDGHTVSKTSGIDVIRNILGHESRTFAEEGDPTRLYVYDDKGFSFVADTVNDALIKLDIFCTSDSKFEMSPRSAFKGRFSIDQREVSFTDTITRISNRTGVAFTQMAPLPWYTKDYEEFSLTIAYERKKKDRISMIHVIFFPTE